MATAIVCDRMQDSNVIVLANLKPRNMRGIKSNGMLMAASDASHENVELLTPPEGSVPGISVVCWLQGGWPETSCLGPRANTEAQVFGASHPGAEVGARVLLPWPRDASAEVGAKKASCLSPWPGAEVGEVGASHPSAEVGWGGAQRPPALV
ncbi:hypothetical protein E2562_003777 [Oryza meyeriana var. granulata]|uniref:tRNA-binding domain-containing protein n=1 Tax=Oryza meyeriana var. granulata TaxID=110450 RepID=A0A6G1BRS3_9ORYZ|nr:hypothetical protein E2562_003777 [Oryza meyeriana var. granulata]